MVFFMTRVLKFSKLYFYLFIFGLSVSIPLNKTSSITLFDLVSVILFCAFLMSGYKLVNNNNSFFSFSFVLLILASFISFYYNNSDYNYVNLFRFLYVPFLIFVTSCVLYAVLSQMPNAKIACTILVIAFCFGSILHLFYPADLRILEYPIKFLLSLSLGVGLAFVIYYCFGNTKLSFVLISLWFVFFSFLSLVEGSRLSFVIYLVAPFYYLSISWLSRKYRYIFFVITVIILFLLISPLNSVLLSLVYIFNNDLYFRTLDQLSFSGNIFISIRPESFINITAFIDSPFFGRGPYNVEVEYLNLMHTLGFLSTNYIYRENAYFHSLFFSSLHMVGVFSIPFWLYILNALFKFYFYFLGFSKDVFFYCMHIIFFYSIWDILFSPPSFVSRFFISFLIACYFLSRNDKYFFTSEVTIKAENNSKCA